ncbi:MAG: hypothetical protein HZA54_10995 [Planctomycetes bacterium]|nr:hypothetical protein [Planctomycetota bacterium]
MTWRRPVCARGALVLAVLVTLAALLSRRGALADDPRVPLPAPPAPPASPTAPPAPSAPAADGSAAAPAPPEDLIGQLPDEWREGARRAFRDAGENAAVLAACLRELALDPAEDQPAEWDAAGFLLANLAPADLAALRPPELLEHLAWIGVARRSLPWVATLPRDLLLHYVLPPRAAQERLRPWRRELYAALAPRVRDAGGLAAAALAVNRWCGERAHFVQTEFRDQGPLETLRAGVGRCEELVILFLCAARAVGIPARSCSTPWWATCDNNHAWIEVWTGDGWHFLGACEPAATLDEAWFKQPARRAAAVYSSCFGLPAPGGEPLYREGAGFALINSTPVYSDTGRLCVQVVDADGRPAPNIPLAACVFNYGALRPVARATTGPDGAAELLLGAGDFALTAGADAVRAFAIVRTEPNRSTAARLVLRPGSGPDGKYSLLYPR